MRDEGKTVIFSTHVMHEAEKLCEFILLINRGQAILDDRLADIRSRQNSQSVCVEVEGDSSFIETLPMVASIESDAERLEISLKEGADSQELLRALFERTRVRVFEVKVPSLHEIFVSLVRSSNAENY